MVKEDNPEQPANAQIPIVVTEEGISKEVKPVQYANAYCEIEVTDEGIVTEVMLAQL
jgi:hypothetical protein